MILPTNWQVRARISNNYKNLLRLIECLSLFKFSHSLIILPCFETVSSDRVDKTTGIDG